MEDERKPQWPFAAMYLFRHKIYHISEIMTMPKEIIEDIRIRL